ncbi:hypothetical protein MMC28_004737 [Mycoblastus sanguinarius]|nr:hypothetical protein [Mycoblastus sanguinarius]
MKCLLALTVTWAALTTGSLSLDSTGIPYAAATGSSSPDAVLTLPPQPAGQSLSSFLDQLFPDNAVGYLNDTDFAVSQNKRAFAEADATTPYTESYGLHQSCWNNDTATGTTTYNISVDFSACASGLKLGSEIGVYTFTNGTTNNDTDLRDMVADLYSLRHSRQTPNPNYANHTAVVAQLAMGEANQLLNNGLICHNTSATAQIEAIVHNELRHLLMNVHSYWTAVIFSASAGAAVGAGIAAIGDVIFNGNVTAENVVQTAVVIGTVVLIGGILTRCHEAGRLDRAENVAARARDLVPQGREAVVQNVYIAWVRRAMQRIARRQVQEALSEAGVTPTNPASIPSLPGSPDSGICLSEMEAGQAGSAIGEMADAALNLESVQQVLEQLGPRDEQGDCSAE